MVIAYTYEADYHCMDCAFSRFGDMLDRDEAVDNEGNKVHPVFSTDEWYANDLFEGEGSPVLGCGTCGKEIARVLVLGD